MLATGGRTIQATHPFAKSSRSSVFAPASARHRATCAGAACFVALLVTGANASANPIEDPHVGDIGWDVPTTDDLSAIYWNPAALGLHNEFRLTVGRSAVRGPRTVDRAAIDPTTGAEGGGRTFAPASGNVNRWPTSKLFGAGSFFAFSLTLGNRVTVAFGTFTPIAIHDHFGPAADGSLPTRYHDLESDLTSTSLVLPALSVRIGGGVRVGIAPTFVFSNGSLIFDQDTGSPSGSAGAVRLCDGAPCGAEHPNAAARYTVATGPGLFDAALSFVLGAGIHIERPRFSAGIGYVSPPLGVHQIELAARQSNIALPARFGSAATICATGFSPCTTGSIGFRLPSMLTGGIDGHVLRFLDLGIAARWVDLSVYDALRIRMVGPAGGAIQTAGLPENVVLHRGLKDTFELRLRSIAKIGTRVQVATSVRFETASAPDEAASPAVFPGSVVEPSLGVRVRLPHVTLSAGYAFSFMSRVTASPSAYDPSANAACESASNDLDAPACRAREAGLARPTAAGTYEAYTQSFGLSVTGAL